MKKSKYVFLVFLSIFFTIGIISMTACSSKIKESVLKSGDNDSDFVQLTKIKDNVWVHTMIIMNSELNPTVY